MSQDPLPPGASPGGPPQGVPPQGPSVSTPAGQNPPPGSFQAGPPVGSNPDLGIRAGSPGTPSDVVVVTRTPSRQRKHSEKTSEIKDPYREIVETVVFVVVLVFMLKTFLAEAFVIPTGSMATTLLGYHLDVTCQQCGYPYQVNCSTEAEEPNGRMAVRIESSECPNCQFNNPR